LITLVLLGGLFSITQKNENQRIEKELAKNGLLIAKALENELSTNLEVLYATRDFIKSSEYVKASEFKSFLNNPIDRHKTIQAISWNRVINGSQREAFESEMKTQFKDFVITERSEKGMVCAANHDKHVVVTYIEPLEHNKQALGYDVYSDPTRRASLDKAQQTGKIIATDPISLVQEKGKQAGILFFLSLEDATPKEANVLKGYVVGVYRAGDLFENILRHFDLKNVALSLNAQIDTGESVPIARYYKDQTGKRIDTLDTIHIEDIVPIKNTILAGQKRWELELYATPEYFSEHISTFTWAVLTISLLFATILEFFLLLLTGRAVLYKKLIGKLEMLSQHDELTGLLNRRSFTDQVEYMLRMEKRIGDPMHMLFLDIDDFKKINDTHGHHIGDMVIKRFATVIKANLREVDLIARWGGEEFVVALMGLMLKDDAKMIANKICKLIEKDEPLKTLTGSKVTVSIGISVLNLTDTFDSAVLRADYAMYRAKENGKNQVFLEE
ncbi:MAG: hypothetical protein RL113_160, partial [Pseudomonadota bacterium]